MVFRRRYLIEKDTNVFHSHNKYLFCFAIVASLGGCSGGKILITDEFEHYNSKEGTFSCDYPKGWEAKGGGKGGPYWAEFKSGDAKIRINGSTIASLIAGDNRSSDMPTQLEPVHIFHTQVNMEAAQEKYGNYTELPGSPKEVACVVGPARLSEFTATTTMGTELHGYRATIIGHNKDVKIICVCPTSKWDDVKPMFDQMFATLKRGVEGI